MFSPILRSEHCSIKELKPKAAGPDRLSPKLIKAARLELVNILLQLLNRAIITSFTPNQWKSANITPIPKFAKPKLTEFRQISNLLSL